MAIEHLVRKKREIGGDLEGLTPLIAPLSSPGVGKADGTLTMRGAEFAIGVIGDYGRRTIAPTFSRLSSRRCAAGA